MRKTVNFKKLLSLLIIIISITSMYSLLVFILDPLEKSPKALNGYLDLSKWNFSSDGLVMLNGEWEFYPNQLYTTDELIDKKVEKIQIPSTWRSKENSNQSPKGYGTYHLRVKLPDSNENKAIKVQSIWMAHNIYINGKLASKVGNVTKTKEGFVPSNTPYIINIEHGNEIDIVVQVSNFIYYDGGIIHPLLLGNESQIDNNELLYISLDMASMFVLLSFSIFHFYMHYMRGKEPTYLFSGIYLFILAIKTITSGEKLLMRLFLDIPFEILYKIQDLSMAISLPVLVLFLYSVEPSIIKKKTGLLLNLPILLYCFIIIMMPYELYLNIKVGMVTYIILLMLFINIRLIILLLKHDNKDIPSNELIHIIISIVLITFSLIDNGFFYAGIINTNIIGRIFGWGFLLSLNAFLAKRYTNKMLEVQKLSDELISANKIKDEFLARTSYEIKTPLNNIYNITSYLLNDTNQVLANEQREQLFLVKDTSDRLSLLVNDLTDIIKLKNEKLDLNLKVIDIYDILQVIIHILSFDLEGKKLKVNNQISPFTFVIADEIRLRQIIYNILENAVKYTNEGYITINQSKGKENIVIQIIDTGIGIDEDMWEIIFSEENIENKQQTTEYGIGLGLYISRQLARKMNGDLWISSSVLGVGTNISLELPIGKNINILSNPSNRKEIQKIISPTYSNSNGIQNTILLVDDEFSNIHIMALILKEKYQIRVATSGTKVMDIVRQEKVDLIITDLMMPGMSGFELIKTIRESYSLLELPIIVSTVRETDVDIELAFKAGASDYIIKPFSKEEILSRVQILFQLKEATETALQNQRAFLQAQIKPHFIYNALNNIIALCYSDGENAAKMLSLLSKYLRYVFQSEEKGNIISLKQEMDLINSYVEIEKLRFNQRLVFNTFIQNNIDVESITIPALLIQPIVENAIRHGIFDKHGEGHVRVFITMDEDVLCILVEDDGVGMSEEQVLQIFDKKLSKGVGIKNVIKRVELIQNASFRIISELGTGTCCKLYLPIEILGIK